jgi:2,4-dienoyl-CoA reductase-like NADH-dependent reductase (Old Yellow Enzyme family)
MAPMTRRKSPNHIPNQQVAEYYRRRAEGGVGLIITEGTVIPHATAHGSRGVPSFYGEALVGWQTVVDAVHKAGARIVPQLWHVGSVRALDQFPESTVAAHSASAIAHPYLGEKAFLPTAMTEEDIYDVIQAYVTAAMDAKKLGFDGIELHGAHGYLIDQFFWDYTNKRTDKYGGKVLAARTRFATEIISAIRMAVGSTFPIIFRFSQWKLGAYDAKLAQTPQELESFLIPLQEAGVDIFHCSTRRYFKPEFNDSSLNLAGWTRKITGKPTITVGSVGLDIEFQESFLGVESKTTDFSNLLERLENEEFDLVAIGRGLIADPYWPKKVAEGRMNEIRPFAKHMLDSLD